MIRINPDTSRFKVGDVVTINRAHSAHGISAIHADEHGVVKCVYGDGYDKTFVYVVLLIDGSEYQFYQDELRLT